MYILICKKRSKKYFSLNSSNYDNTYTHIMFAQLFYNYHHYQFIMTQVKKKKIQVDHH